MKKVYKEKMKESDIKMKVFNKVGINIVMQASELFF